MASVTPAPVAPTQPGRRRRASACRSVQPRAHQAPPAVPRYQAAAAVPRQPLACRNSCRISGPDRPAPHMTDSSSLPRFRFSYVWLSRADDAAMCGNNPDTPTIRRRHADENSGHRSKSVSFRLGRLDPLGVPWAPCRRRTTSSSHGTRGSARCPAPIAACHPRGPPRHTRKQETVPDRTRHTIRPATPKPTPNRLKWVPLHPPKPIQTPNQDKTYPKSSKVGAAAPV